MLECLEYVHTYSRRAEKDEEEEDKGTENVARGQKGIIHHTRARALCVASEPEAPPVSLLSFRSFSRLCVAPDRPLIYVCMLSVCFSSSLHSSVIVVQRRFFLPVVSGITCGSAPFLSCLTRCIYLFARARSLLESACECRATARLLFLCLTARQKVYMGAAGGKTAAGWNDIARLRDLLRSRTEIFVITLLPEREMCLDMLKNS